MSLLTLFNSATPAQTEKIRNTLSAARAGDKETWHGIVEDMTDPERELLIDICNEMIAKNNGGLHHED